MSLELRHRLFHELDRLPLIDPHSHIDPHAPAARNLSEILGYHYYTELAHSAGMPREQIERGADPRERTRLLVERLGPLENTIQYSWLLELCGALLGEHVESLGPDNWEYVYDAAAEKMAAADWEQQVLDKTRLEAVFLTNDFDDPLEGFDTRRYIPCLRTDDLVFQLAQPKVRERLERATGAAQGTAAALDQALAALFDRFCAKGARACAISLPPDFTPAKVSPARVETALADFGRRGAGADALHKQAAARYVFWKLAELCADCGLPFDLMIGVNRNVYPAGVHQGRDLYDSRVSLIQYRELLNAFPQVTFPISVLASVTNQELASYAWIFPNVVAHGHWWYSNTPSLIEHDLAHRLEAVPQTKQIGYYSDMYKLEFGLPKFAMYKRCLAKVLAERFVIDRNWSEERALELGRQVLRGNVERVFRTQEPFAERRASAAAPPPPAVAAPALAVVAGGVWDEEPAGAAVTEEPVARQPGESAVGLADFTLDESGTWVGKGAPAGDLAARPGAADGGSDDETLMLAGVQVQEAFGDEEDAAGSLEDVDAEALAADDVQEADAAEAPPEEEGGFPRLRL